jgi:hypothetical protein
MKLKLLKYLSIIKLGAYARRTVKEYTESIRKIIRLLYTNQIFVK